MKADDIQRRGICQCCGRQQAVLATGLMSKHGYKVEEGWFDGICPGQRFAPMEISRAQADATIKAVRAECKSLRKRHADLKAGKVKPLMAKTGNKKPVEGKHRWEWPDETVPFAQAPEYYQEEAVQSAAWQALRRAEMGESFAADLERLADQYHGKPLVEVRREAGPEPIVKGEQRIGPSGNVLTASRTEGARVYWTMPRGDKVFKGWIGTQAWRRFPKVATAADSTTSTGEQP